MKIFKDQKKTDHCDSTTGKIRQMMEHLSISLPVSQIEPNDVSDNFNSLYACEMCTHNNS